jgi:hypothetical protein
VIDELGGYSLQFQNLSVKIGFGQTLTCAAYIVKPRSFAVLWGPSLFGNTGEVSRVNDREQAVTQLHGAK